MAFAHGIQQGIWLCYLIYELGVHSVMENPISIHVDNLRETGITGFLRHSDAFEHIDIDYHFAHGQIFNETFTGVHRETLPLDGDNS